MTESFTASVVLYGDDGASLVETVVASIQSERAQPTIELAAQPNA